MRVPAKGVGRPGRDLRQLKRVSVPPPGPAPTGHQHYAPPYSVRGPGQPGLDSSPVAGTDSPASGLGARPGRGSGGSR